MQDNVKISNSQFTAIVMHIMVGSAVLVASSGVSTSGRDAWLSGVFLVMLGLPLFWMYLYLGKLYPDKTLFDVIPILLGKWLGKIVVLTLAFLAITGVINQVWVLGDFITAGFLVETPRYAVNLICVFAMACGLHYGLETIARLCESLKHLVLAFFALIMVLLIPNMKLFNLLPVLENGFKPIIFPPFFLLVEAVSSLLYMTVIFPVNAQNVKNAPKAMYRGFLLGTAIIFMVILASILVMGSNVTSNLRYPALNLLKSINVGVIFTRMEALIVIVWLSSNFCFLIMLLYAGIIGLTQGLGLRNYRVIVLPIAFLVFFYSDIIPRSVPDQMTNGPKMVLGYFLFEIGLPLVLFGISLLRKWLGKGEL